jgi:hypothetical protein
MNFRQLKIGVSICYLVDTAKYPPSFPNLGAISQGPQELSRFARKMPFAPSGDGRLSIGPNTYPNLFSKRR